MVRDGEWKGEREDGREERPRRWEYRKTLQARKGYNRTLKGLDKDRSAT